MYTVYVLVNNQGLHYVGQTNNFERRFSEHNEGQSKFTKNKGPFTVLLKEIYSTRSEAMQRERFLKSGKGHELLKEITYRSVV